MSGQWLVDIVDPEAGLCEGRGGQVPRGLFTPFTFCTCVQKLDVVQHSTIGGCQTARLMLLSADPNNNEGEKVMSIKDKAADLRAHLNDFVDAVEDILSDLEGSPSSYPTTKYEPLQTPRVQARLRGTNRLHIQNGVPGGYTTTDVVLSYDEAQRFDNAVENAPEGRKHSSLAGTGRTYLEGYTSQYDSSKVTFGEAVTVSLNSALSNTSR